MTHSIISSKTISFVCLLLFCSTAQAQTIDLSLLTAGGTTTIVQHLQLGTTVNLRIRPTGVGTTGPFNFSITVAPTRRTASSSTTLTPGPDSYTSDGSVTINAVDGSSAASGIFVAGSAGTIEREINFTILATDNSAVPKSRTATVKLVFRNPLKLVFVVDRSGSMECRPNEPSTTTGPTGWPDCEASVTPPKKWFLAQDALSVQFAPKMLSSLNSTFFPSADLIGVSYFDGVISPTSVFPTSFVDVATFSGNPNGVLDDFNAQYSSGDLGRNGTNIGVGMTNANTKIGALSPNFREVIVLITDGMQNNTLTEQIHNNGFQLNDGTLLNNNEASASFIQVYSLGFDASTSAGSYGALLSAISTNPTQNYFYTNSVGSYTPIFNDIFARVFDNFSPQIVHIGNQTMTTDSLIETVVVNNGGAVLMFSVGFENSFANNYTYTLRKDGQDMGQYVNRTIGNYSALLSINLLEHPELNSGGVWQVVCYTRYDIIDRNIDRRDENRFVKASVVCTIDEPVLDASYGVGKDKFVVGDAVKPSVKLSKNGVPVTNAVITAELIRPGDDKGDLVARAKVSSTVTPGSEINNVFSAKYANILATNPAYLASVAPISRTITLSDKGNGRYEGEFPQKLDASDNCDVVFKVSFKDSTLGQVFRNQRLSTFVRFGEIDINLVDRKMKSFTSDGIKFYQLTVSPASNVGGKVRLVGPGYEQAFTIGKKRTTLKDVTDNGDGSYTFTVTSKQPNQLYLLDEPLYSGPYSFFRMPYTKYKWNVSGHLGGTAPLGDLDTLYDNGAFLELDFGRRIWPFLSIDLHGGYYAFKSSYNALGITAYLTGYFLPNPSWNIGVSGGGGFYSPKNLDPEFGYSYRFLIERNMSQHFSTGAELGRITGTKSDLDFLVYGLSLKYRF